MRTAKEYEDIFYGVQETAFQGPINTRRDINVAAAEARRRMRIRRDELTKEITQIWRDGFKALKEENDEMQKNLREGFKNGDILVSDWISDTIVGIQK